MCNKYLHIIHSCITYIFFLKNIITYLYHTWVHSVIVKIIKNCIYLTQHKVKLCISLVHFVSLQEAEVGTTQQVILQREIKLPVSHQMIKWNTYSNTFRNIGPPIKMCIGRYSVEILTITLFTVESAYQEKC